MTSWKRGKRGWGGWGQIRCVLQRSDRIPTPGQLARLGHRTWAATGGRTRSGGGTVMAFWREGETKEGAMCLFSFTLSPKKRHPASPHAPPRPRSEGVALHRQRGRRQRGSPRHTQASCAHPPCFVFHHGIDRARPAPAHGGQGVCVYVRESGSVGRPPLPRCTKKKHARFPRPPQLLFFCQVKTVAFHPVLPWLAFADVAGTVVVWDWEADSVREGRKGVGKRGGGACVFLSKLFVLSTPPPRPVPPPLDPV